MNTKNEVRVARPEVEPTSERPVYVPRADISESAEAYHLWADMPGADEQSVDVTLERNVLTIAASFELPRLAGQRLVYGEFEGGQYRRSFQLTSEIDSAKIRAEMKNGLLHLTVPKQSPVRTKIAVSAS